MARRSWDWPLKKISSSSYPPSFFPVVILSIGLGWAIPNHFSNTVFLSLHLLQCHKIHTSLKACSLDSFQMHRMTMFPYSKFISLIQVNAEAKIVRLETFPGAPSAFACPATLALTLLTSWLAHVPLWCCATICAHLHKPLCPTDCVGVWLCASSYDICVYVQCALCMH